MSKATLTPNQLAEKLAGAANRDKVGKTFVRPFLRKHYAREAGTKGTGWLLTDEQVAAVTAAYRARTEGKAFDFAAWKKSRKSKPKPAATVTPDATPEA